MTLLGARALNDLVNLTGWDADQISKISLRDGTTVEAVLAELRTAMGAASRDLMTGIFGTMVHVTDKETIKYRMGSTNGFQEHTEYSRPDGERSLVDGHMLPFKKWDRGLEWTYDYLTEEADMYQIRSDISVVVREAKDLWRQKILTRCLKRGDESGTNLDLGSSGLSPGFATTAASTGVDFTPPDYNGKTFTNTHEHYKAIAGGVYTADVFKDAKAELREHGHEPPYIWIAGSSDESTIEGLTGFEKGANQNLIYGDDTTIANISTESDPHGNRAIGEIHGFFVYIVGGMPQYYGFGYKSYGFNSQKNPIAIRLRKGQLSPSIRVFADPSVGSPTHPLQYLMSQIGFGVGVGMDRTNGVAQFVNNASWSDGTPT